MEPSTLCYECREILNQVLSLDEMRTRDYTFSREAQYLALTQAKACPLCSTLVQSWGKYLPEHAEFLIRLEDLDGPSPKLHVFAAWQDTSRPTVSYFLQCEEGEQTPKAEYLNESDEFKPY